MTTPSAPAPGLSTVERLRDSLALITAAQAMLRGELSAPLFAEHVQVIGRTYANPTDALTHLAIVCAQILRTASRTTPDTALSHTGIALAAYEPPTTQPR